METASVTREEKLKSDFLQLIDIDHIEFYVGNAKQAVHFYQKTFGFNLTGYSGLETGIRDRASYLLEQKNVRFVFTTPLEPDHPSAEHVKRHGDGVRDIAFRVKDCETAYREATDRGGIGVQEPVTQQDEFGIYKKASIATYGDTIHSFIEKEQYDGNFAPGFIKVDNQQVKVDKTALLFVDHVVGNVELGQMNRWVEFYQNVMGFSLFKHFDDKDISTKYSALMSKVMSGGRGKIKFPINEPAKGVKKSQIQEYLDYYKTAGVQHIALLTGDIISSVTKLHENGVEFLYVPTSYYDELEERVGKIDEPVDKLKELGILVDRDDEGYLLQIFTKPVEDRPTLFYEIIQRKGSQSFGKGNFKALFESIEMEQARRGNL